MATSNIRYIDAEYSGCDFFTHLSDFIPITINHKYYVLTCTVIIILFLK